MIPAISPLFAEVLLIWHAANYLLSADPGRSGPPFSRRKGGLIARFVLRACAAAILTVVVTAPGSGMPLATALFAGCLLLPLARWLWVPARFTAELEIAANAGMAALLAFLIGHYGWQARWTLPHPRAKGYLVAAALMIFVVRGGTHIVRGVLDRAGTMPPPEFPPSQGLTADFERALPVDTIELNHGRLIGNVERIILVLFVANGQYTALAFFFAAKGLIRSKDIERRAWADYLILGSLTSFLVAVVAGLLVQAVLQAP